MFSSDLKLRWYCPLVARVLDVREFIPHPRSPHRLNEEGRNLRVKGGDLDPPSPRDSSSLQAEGGRSAI